MEIHARELNFSLVLLRDIHSLCAILSVNPAKELLDHENTARLEDEPQKIGTGDS